MNKDNIVLIGMPGSGKSTIGKELALKLGYDSLDIDVKIERDEGMEISQIMKSKGQDYFKKLEGNYILSINNLSKTIISPGGSVIYSEKSMNHLRNIAQIIFLDIPFEILEQRLKKRPTLNNLIGFKEKGLLGLYNERLPLYKKYADKIVELSGKEDVKEVVEILTRVLF
jgi:shikimate kinase